MKFDPLQSEDDAGRAEFPGNRDEGIDILAFAASVWRRRAIVLGVAAILFVIAFVYVLQLTPRYEASSLVRIGGPKSNVVDIQEVLQGPGQEQGVVDTEIEVISSRDLLGRVAGKLQLEQNPVFNPALRAGDGSAWRYVNPLYYVGLVRGLFAGQEQPSSGLTDEDAKVQLRSQITDRLSGMLKVRRVRLSSVVSITIEAEDPALAARLANTIAEQYIVSQYETKFQAAESASKWLNERLGNLRQEVEAAEGALEQYRAKTGQLSGSSNNTLLSEQASQLNAQLIIARTETATINSKLARIEEMYGTGGVEGVAKVLDSEAIVRLRSKESDLTRQIADLSQEFGARHPKMIGLKAQLEDTRAQIRQEVEKILVNLRNDAAAQRAKSNTLQAGLNSMQGEVGARSQQSAELAMLEREAAAKRTLFDTFLKRFQETSNSESLQQADATIVSRADRPRMPSFPKTGRFLILSIIGALGAGIGTAVFVERILDRGYRRLDQVEAATGLTALGAVPQVAGGDLIDAIINKPNSSFTEAIRNLHAGIRLSSVDDDAKVILFTSAVPGEGKTAISTSLAVLLARAGYRTLLIDCDLRRGRTDERLGLQSKPGLVELLVEPDLEGAVQLHEASGLNVVVGGGTTRNPQDLLASNAMREFIARARTSYDYVIIDTPPSSVVSEARILAAAADRVVLICKWNATPRNIVIGAERQMAAAGAQFAGVVISQVAPRSGLIYGYDSYSPYYGKYGQYAQYYQD